MKTSPAKRTAPEKPAYEDPCKGCGFCCAAEPCDLAEDLLGATAGPCPAMEFEGTRFWCGLVRNPEKHLGVPAWGNEMVAGMIGSALGINRGCDSPS